MKLRQLQKVAAKSCAQAKAAKNRFELLSDHAKAAKELVKAVKIKFKVTRKALKQARKNAELSALDRKQARKAFERAAAVAAKHQRRLKKAKGKEISQGKTGKGPAVIHEQRGPVSARKKSSKKQASRNSKVRVQVRARTSGPKLNRYIPVKAQGAASPVSIEQNFATTPTLDTPEKVV